MLSYCTLLGIFFFKIAIIIMIQLTIQLTGLLHYNANPDNIAQ